MASRYKKFTVAGHKVTNPDDGRKVIYHEADEILSLSPEVSKDFAHKLAYILDEAIQHGYNVGHSRAKLEIRRALGIKQDD